MRPLFCVAVATALFAPMAYAEPLTFAAALKLADQSAPSLAAKSADVDAARAQALAAGRLPDPKLRTGVENFPISGPPAGTFNGDSMTMATIGIVQDVPNGDKRKAERLKAAADIDAAQAGFSLEGRNVRLNTANAWIDLYYAERELAALDQIDRAIAPIQTSAASQLASGATRPAQALDAETLLATLADRRAELVARVGSARAALVRWTGDDTADVMGTPPEFDVNPATLRASLERNPALNVYGPMTRQADADIALARADKRSDWGWDVTYQHRDPRWGDMVSAGVTVSLPLFPRTRQDPMIEAKTQAATSVRLQRDAAYRDLSAQLDADLADHVMHHDQWMRSQTTLVPLAQKKVDLETASYGAGSASLSDVLQAQLTLAEAKIESLNREAAAVRDAARIVLTYGSHDQ